MALSRNGDPLSDEEKDRHDRVMSGRRWAVLAQRFESVLSCMETGSI